MYVIDIDDIIGKDHYQGVGVHHALEIKAGVHFTGKIASIDVSGIADESVKAAILAHLEAEDFTVGEENTDVTDNGDGTWTLRYWVQLDAETIAELTKNADDDGLTIKIGVTLTNDETGAKADHTAHFVFEKIEEPEVKVAVWKDSGIVGTNTIEGKAYVFQGFELLDAEGKRIDLVANNIESMTVLEPGASEPKTLTVGDDSDPLLWFNVQKATGDYKYTVVTKAGATYVATLNWTAPAEGRSRCS